MTKPTPVETRTANALERIADALEFLVERAVMNEIAKPQPMHTDVAARAPHTVTETPKPKNVDDDDTVEPMGDED